MQTYLLLYILAGLLLFVEAFTPGTFLFVCFALGTAIAGAVDHIWGLELRFLLGIDLMVSLLALFTVRPLLKMIIKAPAETDPSNYGTYSERLLGREAMVFKPITKHETGLVKLYDFDETWLAKSEDGSEIGQGTTVAITKVEGNQLVVKTT